MYSLKTVISVRDTGVVEPVRLAVQNWKLKIAPKDRMIQSW